LTNITNGSHIVEDFYIGNTHIMIADDYCRDKTSEDVRRILQEIAWRAQESLSAAATEEAIG